MNKPTLDELMKKIESKYTLVVVAAKRARQFSEKGSGYCDKSIKPVTIALNEIMKGQVKFERTRSGIK